MYKKLLFILIIIFCSSSFVLADSITTQDVTWYYRNMTNESTMNSTIKSVDTYVNLVASSSTNQEYLNGYTTRISSNFTKDFQYNINYTLRMLYDSTNDGNFRSDTITRLKNFAYVDSDFTLINSTINQIKYECEAMICTRIFSINISAKANVNTSAIRFGVYTTNNISLGFYNHYIGNGDVSSVRMILSETTNITENSNSVIIGQNETIINQNNQAIEQGQQNTQDIIDNNNDNTDRIIEDNKKNFQTCRDSLNLFQLEYILQPSQTSISAVLNSGVYTLSLENHVNFGNVIYIQLYKNGTIVTTAGHITNTSSAVSFSTSSYWYYFSNIPNGNKLTFTLDDNYSVKIGLYGTDGTKHAMLNSGSSALDYEPYGEEICTNKLDEQTNAINGLNDTINDDNVDSATSDAGDFITSFDTDTFGLTSIITAPLNLIQSLTNSSCTALHIPLPYLNNKYLDLPCMSTIYQQHFGSFFTLYQTITYGIIAYWVCVRIFNQVKDFKNPEHDEIEVLDL